MTHPMRTRGFSLIEVLIASMLVGLAIAALVVANGTFTMANYAGADLTTAEFLIEQIREMTAMLSVMDPSTMTPPQFGVETDEASVAAYDDVDDFDGVTFSPPIDAARMPLPDLAAFTQLITVDRLNPSNFNEVWADTAASDFFRVTVSVTQNGRPISSANWVRARY